MISRQYRILAWSTFVGMLFVLLAGAIVTQTGSGRGCGSDWPLCHGKFIPAYTLESMIEYSHRMITGIVGLLVLLTFILTWFHRREHREAYAYAGGTLLFTVIQALMGAAAVKWPQQPAVMALHFGISLLAVASSMMLVLWIYRMKQTDRQSVQTPPGFAVWAWGIWVFTYGVIYLGAFIRHREAAGGCIGWPLCNGRLVPDFNEVAGVVFAHRLAAVLLFILTAIWALLVRRAERRNQASGMGTAVSYLLLCILFQIMSGAWLTAALDRGDELLFVSLLHNIIATILFSLLTDIAIRSWIYRRK
ncbi:heme A synthase [Paenibacillus sp. NPDC056722]|uniref:COX15/CtaA family protein n=1 Tax=Paenibacillus sp. NPDC056722 TaxID=3345924 RepID=UPI0036952483